MSTLGEFPSYVLVMLVALAVMLALNRLALRDKTKSSPTLGARARIEQRGTEVTIVVPPQPGARWFVLTWTIAAAAFMAYVCVIIDTTLLGWALFVGSAALLAALVAQGYREIFSWYFVIGADGNVRSAHAARWRTVDSGPLSPSKQRGALRMGRDRQGNWYFQHEGRAEEYLWGRLSDADAATLRGLGVPDDAGTPDSVPKWSLVTWLSWLSDFVLLAVFAYPLLSPLGKIEGLPKPRLAGSFRADHAALGSWQLTPTRCLSGRERGFEGVLFQFASGSALRELRIDMERPGDARIELQFFEPSKPPVRMAQRECERIDGKTDARVVVINGRDMDLLTGELHVACAGRGLTGDVVFAGCLP